MSKLIRLAIFIIAVFVVGVSVTLAQTPYISVSGSNTNNPQIVNASINVTGVNVNYIQVFSNTFQCPRADHITTYDNQPSFPLVMQLPRGTYRVVVNYNNNQSTTSNFSLVDNNIACPQESNPVQNVVLNEVSDWILATYGSLGLCQGHTSNLFVGERVLPNFALQHPTVVVRDLPRDVNLTYTRQLEELEYNNQYAIVLSGPVCNENTTWRYIGLEMDWGFVYGWVPEIKPNGYGGVINTLLETQNTVPADNHALSVNYFLQNRLSIESLLSSATTAVGYSVMFENVNAPEPRGLAVRNVPGYRNCIAGSRVLTRITIEDGYFWILNRNRTGTWLQVQLQNGTVGWVATRLTYNNLDNQSVFATLPPMQEFTDCPSILP